MRAPVLSCPCRDGAASGELFVLGGGSGDVPKRELEELELNTAVWGDVKIAFYRHKENRQTSGTMCRPFECF
jgi:hypothetical protein